MVSLPQKLTRKLALQRSWICSLIAVRLEVKPKRRFIHHWLTPLGVRRDAYGQPIAAHR